MTKRNVLAPMMRCRFQFGCCPAHRRRWRREFQFPPPGDDSILVHEECLGRSTSDRWQKRLRWLGVVFFVYIHGWLRVSLHVSSASDPHEARRQHRVPQSAPGVYSVPASVSGGNRPWEVCTRVFGEALIRLFCAGHRDAFASAWAAMCKAGADGKTPTAALGRLGQLTGHSPGGPPPSPRLRMGRPGTCAAMDVDITGQLTSWNDSARLGFGLVGFQDRVRDQSGR